jgi:2-keto-4-pentenoate hydratase/2-oxohepta-3-ene-1,7-dioic acid hydratase in catechol pathway
LIDRSKRDTGRNRANMKLLQFQGGDGLKLGVKTDNGIVDVAAAAAALGLEAPTSLIEVVEVGQPAIDAVQAVIDAVAASDNAAEWTLDEMGIQYGPAVADPGKIICVGLNYRRHAAETGMPVPETPVLFSKFSNSIAAYGDSVSLPAVATEYDYEVELGVVIGKPARNVSEAEALDYVLGYVTSNDISVRDLQTRTSQWLLGKTLDNFLPVGPYLVTADEVGDPQQLSIKTWVNGEIRQDSNTGDMIFTVAEIVSYISRYFTLEPGDLIVTGTPEGVAMGREDKPWLKPGDEVVVEVGSLGVLKNVMVA